MSPPIDIDGSEIQEATIDGQDVSEITIDGQQAAELNVIPDSDPVAKSNLVAWWRFGDGDQKTLEDSANTANFGDSTPYDFTEQGQSTQEENGVSSGGVTDIEDGANSSAYDMIPDGNLESSLTNLTSPFTVMGYVNFDSLESFNAMFGDWNSGGSDFYINYLRDSSKGFKLNDDLGEEVLSGISADTNEWYHVSGVYNSTNRIYVDGIERATDAGVSSGNYTSGDGFDVGSLDNSIHFSDGRFDDVRVYNRELTASEISSIFNATKP